MKKSAWYVLILVLVLIAAVMISVLRLSFDKKDDTAGAETPTAEQTDGRTSPTPESTPDISASPDETPEPSPGEESAETPSPSPSEAPAETETPTETSDARTKLGQGSFSSATGTGLELTVAWTAYDAGGGSADVRFDIGVSSYGLNTTALYNSITVTVGGRSYSLSSPEVSSEASEPTATALASQTVTLPLDGGRISEDVTVNWNFRGSYGGTELENITASGSVSAG